MIKSMVACAGILWAAASPSSCESSQQIASACEDGVCPDQPRGPGDGPQCAFVTTAFDVALSESGGEISGVCLPRLLPRRDDGTADCTLTVGWGDSTESQCARVGGTLTSSLGTFHCEVPQVSSLAAMSSGAMGWYVDTASANTQDCAPAPQQRVAFTTDLIGDGDAAVTLSCSYAIANSNDVGSLADTPTTDVRPDVCASFAPPAAVTDVGAPCVPDVQPDQYDLREAYVETTNAQCVSGVCLVYQLEGAIPGTDGNCQAEPCAAAEEVSDRVYCSCRCSADEPGDAPLCDCPEGFACREMILNGPAAGGYCVDLRT